MDLKNNWILVYSDGLLEELNGMKVDNSYCPPRSTFTKVTLRQIGTITKERTGFFTTGFECINPKLEIGDTLICEWGGIYAALQDEALQYEDCILIPYDSIIARYNDKIEAFNGNIIFTDIELDEVVGATGYEAIKKSWRKSKAVSCNHIERYFLENRERQKREYSTILVQEGDTIIYDSDKGFFIEEEGFVTLDQRYGYIKELNVLAIC